MRTHTYNRFPTTDPNIPIHDRDCTHITYKRKIFSHIVLPKTLTHLTIVHILIKPIVLSKKVFMCDANFSSAIDSNMIILSKNLSIVRISTYYSIPIKFTKNITRVTFCDNSSYEHLMEMSKLTFYLDLGNQVNGPVELSKCMKYLFFSTRFNHAVILPKFLHTLIVRSIELRTMCIEQPVSILELNCCIPAHTDYLPNGLKTVDLHYQPYTFPQNISNDIHCLKLYNTQEVLDDYLIDDFDNYTHETTYQKNSLPENYFETYRDDKLKCVEYTNSLY